MHATFIRSTNRQGALKTVTINVRKVFTEKRSNCVKRGLNTYQGTCKENRELKNHDEVHDDDVC